MSNWSKGLLRQEKKLAFLKVVFFDNSGGLLHYCCWLEVIVWLLFNLPSHHCSSPSLGPLLSLSLHFHYFPSPPLFFIYLFICHCCRLLLSSLDPPLLLPLLLWLLSSCPFAGLLPQPQHTGHYCKQGFTSSTESRVRGWLEVWSCCVDSIWPQTHTHINKPECQDWTCQDINTHTHTVAYLHTM